MHQSVRHEVLPLLLLLSLSSAHLRIDPVTFKTDGQTVAHYEYCVFWGQRLVKHDSAQRVKSQSRGGFTQIGHPRV